MWWSSIVGSVIGASAALFAAYTAQTISIRNRQASERLALSSALRNQAVELRREIHASPNWKDWRSLHNITETMNHMEAACARFPKRRRVEVLALIDEAQMVSGCIASRSANNGGGLSDEDWQGFYRWLVLVSFAMVEDMNRRMEEEYVREAVTFYNARGLSAVRPNGPVRRTPLNKGWWQRFRAFVGIQV
jgi:hypothetical protein